MTRKSLHPLQRADTRVHTRTAVAALTEVVRKATEETNKALTAEVREVKKATEEVKMALSSTGQLSLSTRTLAELYRDAMSTQRLQLGQLPTWFAPDPEASMRAWTRLPPNTSEEKVQKEFELGVLPLAAASRNPTLVLLGSSTSPTIGTRKPDVVGCVAAPFAPDLADARPLSRFVTHIACVGSLKARRAAGNEGKFSDDEKGGALSFADALVRKQPWRAHDGSFARVVVFLSDGAHIVFFECTFRVEVRSSELHVEMAAVRECAPLPLDGEGDMYLAGLTLAPLATLGHALPQCEVDGEAVDLSAYLGVGATSAGFAGTWRGDAVVFKHYHAAMQCDVAQCELKALLAAAGVPGVCALRGQAANGLLLAPLGVVTYSLHVRASSAPRAPAPAGLWSLARSTADPGVPEMPMPRAATDPMLPSATEFCDLVDALAGLHAVGWVHRDPRPTNFFRDAAGSFFLADLGSAAPIGDETVWIDDERPWAPQYGPLAVLRAVAAGVAQPLPAPAHDFEQVARLAYASSSRAAETMPAQGSELCKWWEQQDKTPFLSALLPAAAAAATGDAAAREAFKEALRTWVALP